MTSGTASQGATAAARYRQERRMRMVGRSVAYAILTFAFLASLLPFLWTIVSSVKTTAQLFLTPFALPRWPYQWSNYSTAWIAGHFSTFFYNSVGIAIPQVLGVLLCGSLSGFAFARLNFWGNTVIFYVFLASMAISTNSIMIPLFFMVVRFGLVNTWAGVIIPSIGSSMPMATFLMRAAFRGLPSELEDAARIDGCSDFGLYWRVMLPLARPAVFALAIFSFMGAWNSFLVPLLVLREHAKRTIPVGLRAFMGIYLTNFPVLFAGIVISFIPSLVIYYSLQRHFERGLTLGSVTG